MGNSGSGDSGRLLYHLPSLKLSREKNKLNAH